MPVTANTNTAARTALGTCLGALLTLCQPLRNCFSPEVQPLLPTTATMAIFCAGRSLEESLWLSVEAFAGCVLAALNTVVLRNLFPMPSIPTDSWLGQFVLLEGAIFVALMCVTPVSESTKMYTSSLTAYFLMSMYSGTELSVLRQCLEYLAMSSFGSICLVVAYAMPLPWLPDTRGLHMAERAFDEVADECAETITEATTALLSSGAGEAWRSVARGRLALLSDKLADARSAVDYVECSPAAAIRRLTRVGRAAAQARQVHREAAFRAAAEAIDTCRLLCELAISVHTHSDGVGLAVVRSAAAACLLRVSANAASLLRDFSRTSFRRVPLDESLGDLGASLGDERRQRLRKATRTALRNSSVAGRELLWVGLYAAEEGSSVPKGDLARARSDLAAFLFLVHGLAADLLRAEATALRAARAAARAATAADDPGFNVLRYRSTSLSDLEEGLNEDDDEASEESTSNLQTPLLRFPARVREGMAMVKEPSLVPAATFRAAVFAAISGMVARVVADIRSAFAQRWRIALKVFLQYYPSFWMSVYLFNKDGTLVTAASMLCSYGSQYDGGSLRRSVSRIVGVAGGASFGSALEQLFASVFTHAAWLEDEGFDDVFEMPGSDLLKLFVYQGGALFTSLLLLWSATFVGVLLCFRGGPHAYAGFCAGFTAAKFLLCSSAGCLQVSSAITFNMYAASLAVAVEMGVLPIHAIDLLRVRLSGALLGAAAALSSLVTLESSTPPIMTKLANETLKQSRARIGDHPAASDVKPILRTLQDTGHVMSWRNLTRAAEAEQLAHGELPDLTERLRRAGVLDKYVAWRDSYFQWRTGHTKGARGELGAPSPKSSPETSPQAAAAVLPSPSVHAEFEESACAQSQARESRDEPPLLERVPRATTEPSPSCFAPPAEALSVSATLEPFAGVELPRLDADDSSIHGGGSGQDHGDLASSIMLKSADPAFLQGLAHVAAPDEHAAGGVGGACGKLDLGAALDMPHISELLRQQKEAPQEEPPEEGRATADEPEADGGDRTATPPSVRWQKTRILAHSANATSGQQWGSARPDVDMGEPAEFAMPPTPMVATASDKPCLGGATMSLAQVQMLLDEIDSALAPSADLAAQAGERLDAQRVDTHMWQRLATAIAVVRVRLSMLARIALRLQHGVRVPDLMGGEREAGEALVEAFGGALAAATAAVAGGAPPPPRMCAELEAKLRDSTEALSDALARRRSPELSKLRAAGSAEVTSEVLAGTAAHTLIALLGDARELLFLACALSGSGAPLMLGNLDKVGPLASGPSGDSGGGGAVLALPDLTERLKQAGTYDKYLAWRDGYMKWRGGSGHGAKGEMTDTAT